MNNNKLSQEQQSIPLVDTPLNIPKPQRKMSFNQEQSMDFSSQQDENNFRNVIMIHPLYCKTISTSSDSGIPSPMNRSTHNVRVRSTSPTDEVMNMNESPFDILKRKMKSQQLGDFSQSFE